MNLSQGNEWLPPCSLTRGWDDFMTGLSGGHTELPLLWDSPAQPIQPQHASTFPSPLFRSHVGAVSRKLEQYGVPWYYLPSVGRGSLAWTGGDIPINLCTLRPRLSLAIFRAFATNRVALKLPSSVRNDRRFTAMVDPIKFDIGRRRI